jgi:tryptophanyl-tRNA synthetase
MTEKKKRLFSGIQPTGTIHIGNYFGAIKNWIELVDKYETFFSIVDYHAITVPYETELMEKRIFEAVITNIAAGLDPEKATLFVQSDVPQHTELSWIFTCLAKMGDLSRMTQYKQKSQQYKSILAGIFCYPVLQTADIALYKGEVVPVGEDQVQHIELAREIIRDFNERFGYTFPEPQEYLASVPRILGLDGENKMSKSLNNYIALTEEDDELWKKLSTAKTDTNRMRRKDPGNPDVCNLYSYHKLVSSEEEQEEVATGCRTAGIGCLDCKKILFKNFQKLIAPIREKKKEL